MASSPAEWGVASQQGCDISNTLVVAWLSGWQDAPPPQCKGAQRAQSSGAYDEGGSGYLSMNRVRSGDFGLENQIVFFREFLEQTLFSLSDFLFVFLEPLFHVIDPVNH